VHFLAENNAPASKENSLPGRGAAPRPVSGDTHLNDTTRNNDQAETLVDIEFRGISKRFGDVLAVERADLAVTKGSFFSLLGPSGCGKTTSLRMIAGFEEPTEGDVLIQGRSMVGIPPYRRPVNMVFQHYALFPHLNVFDNIAYGLRQRRPRPDKAEVTRRVGEALEMVRLSGFEARPSLELSGGQQQRVALARALINRPTVLLLDEPLAALDRKLRRDMQIELQTLQREVGITFALVTNDQEEALSMSDAICIMEHGRIVQTGTPRALYDEPINKYVADFVGKSNFFDGTVEEVKDSGAVLKLDSGQSMEGRFSRTTEPLAKGRPASIAVRPETISIGTPGAAEDGMAITAAGRVKNRIYLGEQTEYLVATETHGDILVLAPKASELASGGFAAGDAVEIWWPHDAALALDNG